MSEHDRDIDPARRALLLAALAAGAFALPHPGRAEGVARSIHRLAGNVRVNGAAATVATLVRPGDVVETGADGEVVFAVASDAFLLRRNARLELAPAADDGTVVEALRVVTGALLSVFARRTHRIDTPIATIGIRGTGVYVEVEPERDYVCTCYGETHIAAMGDATSRATVKASHHDAPQYVLAAGASGERVRAAPMKNHTDAELVLLESLVGREPPFGGSYDDYGRPRRRSY